VNPEINMMYLVPPNRGHAKTSASEKNAVIADVVSADEGSVQPKKFDAPRNERTSSPVSRGAAFKKIVESVIKANKKAKANADDSTQQQTPDGQALISALQPIITADGFSIDSLLQGVSALGGQSGEADGKAAINASTLVQNALKIISQLLHLNVAQGFQDVKLDNPSEGLKNQLAEVLNVLKGIDGLLMEAGRTNQSLTINGASFDPAQVIAAEKVLRVEMFHFEMALSMAGISGDIAQRLAREGNQQSSSGIVSATSPQLLSMPQQQIAQALGSGLDATNRTAETELRALAATLQKSASTLEKSVLTGKIATVATTTQSAVQPGAQPDQNGVAQVNAGQNVSGADSGVFDAKTLRTLLKIDTTEQENKAAASGTEKLHLSDQAKTLFAKNLGAAAENREEKTGPVAADPSLSRVSSSSLFKASDSQMPVGKTLEDSVITQLSDKIQAAVKTGVTEIRLLLRPESLGEMRVKLTLEGDVVMGKIYVENQQVKHIIETNMQSLKDSLAQHNLQTGSFDVNVGGGWKDPNPDPAFAESSVNSNENQLLDAENKLRPAETVLPGLETGRKFGSNTVEYFA